MVASTRIPLLVLVSIVAAALGVGCSSDDAPPNPNTNAAGASGAQAGGGASAAGSSSSIGGMSVAGAVSGGPSGGGGAAAGSSGAGAASGGASGGGGSAGGAGGSGGGGAPAVRSAGCGMPATQALNSWVEQPKLKVNNADRQWWIWLPTNYDPARAYPLIYTFHGCGGPTNYIPMQKQTGNDAILIRGTGSDPNNGICWSYGGEGNDVKFFDATLAAIQASSCIDTSRVFAMGYSSGGWMTNVLECTRGDKLRATGTLSGGVPGGLGTCKGKFARATVHDLNDGTNPFDGQGAKQELDRVLTQNHCNKTLPPVMEDPEPCARYQGCDAGFPVIACRTMGKGHERQDTLAMDAFWRLFKSL